MVTLEFRTRVIQGVKVAHRVFGVILVGLVNWQNFEFFGKFCPEILNVVYVQILRFVLIMI